MIMYASQYNIPIIRIAIILYGTAFLIYAVLMTLKIVFMQREIKEDGELLIDKAKTSLGWLIIRLILSILLFTGAVIFLVLM